MTVTPNFEHKNCSFPAYQNVDFVTVMILRKISKLEEKVDHLITEKNNGNKDKVIFKGVNVQEFMHPILIYMGCKLWMHCL